MDAAELKSSLASKADAVEAMPRLASELRVDEQVTRRAMGNCRILAKALRRLDRR